MGINMSIKNPAAPTPTPLPYSPSIAAGGFLFVSGQASVDNSGVIIPDTFEAEVRRSFAHVSRILAESGLSFEDIIQVRCYVRDPENIPEYNEIYRDIFNKPYPARTTLVGCLPESIQFEVDVVAKISTTCSGSN